MLFIADMYDKIFQIHGQLMTLVWVILGPCSIWVVRHGNQVFKRKNQIRVHILINAIMALAGGAGIYLAVSSCSHHFASLHQKLGLAIAVLALVQGLTGILQVKFKWLKKLHAVLGPLVWFMAMNNAVLGAEMLGWNASVYLAAWMFLVISFFLYLEIEARPPARVYLTKGGKRVSSRKATIRKRRY